MLRGDLSQVHGVTAHRVHAGEFALQVLVQFLIELEHQQVVEIVGRHEGGRSHVHEPSLDVLERGMGAKLVGVGDHIVPADSAGDDGPQQPGG